jgi:hypothetical protein
MTLMKALHLAVVVAASVALCGSINEALAESSACHDLVGTYLTKNFAKGESGANFTSRSLLALSGSGWLRLRIPEKEGRRASVRSRTDAARGVASTPTNCTR